MKFILDFSLMVMLKNFVHMYFVHSIKIILVELILKNFY
ncbi:unnamed protein product [Schistosoma mattheei]|uniref:Uncharacterized protein n=1 Tax=Schistosoma mattheei TaxID=31246 RepID=A0A3P8K0N0_9TREM|nr:unnamed protein product [Schistosoma mattheei]